MCDVTEAPFWRYRCIGQRRDRTLVDRVKKIQLAIYHLHHCSWCFYWLCCASSGSSCTLIDSCLVQSAVSNLFPNQWCCLKLYLPLPVCLMCRCVFWVVVLFSDLSLCFLTCYNVFGIVVVFWIILFFRFAFAFVICYFVFRIVICFALLGHRSSRLILCMRLSPSSDNLHLKTPSPSLSIRSARYQHSNHLLKHIYFLRLIHNSFSRVYVLYLFDVL